MSTTDRNSSAGGREEAAPSRPEVGVRARPSLEAILRPFSSARPRGGWTDALLFHAGRALQGILGNAPGRGDIRPGARLLAAAVQEVLRCYRDPVFLETGPAGSTPPEVESTVTVASVLRGQGRFLSLAESDEVLEARRDACGNLSQWVEYVQGDPATRIQRLREEGALEEVHLAFLNSSDDPRRIGAEFYAVAGAVVEGGIVIIDEAVPPGSRAGRVMPELRDGTAWDARIAHATRGLLVAQRRPPP